MISDTQSICHDPQRWIGSAARDKKTRVHYVELIQVMCLAIDIQCGSCWVVPQTYCSALMCYTCQRDGAIQEELIGQDMIIAIADLIVICRYLLLRLKYSLANSMIRYNSKVLSASHPPSIH